MFSTIRPYIIYIYCIYDIGIQKIHPSLMDPLSIQWEADLAQSFGQLWDIRSISILTAYRRTRKIQPNDPTKHASQKRCHSHQRSLEHNAVSPYRSEALSILSLMYLPLPSLFLLQLWVKQQLDCTLSQLSHDHLQGLVCCLPKIHQWKSHGEIRIRLCGLEFMLLSWTNLGSEAETSQFCEKYILSLVVTLYIIGICLQYPFYLIFRSNIQQCYLTFDKNQSTQQQAGVRTGWNHQHLTLHPHQCPPCMGTAWCKTYIHWIGFDDLTCKKSDQGWTISSCQFFNICNKNDQGLFTHMSISSICLLCFIFWASAIICSTSSLVTFHVIKTCIISSCQ